MRHAPTNDEVANALYEIGEILELLDEDPFKVIAYRNAAQSIEFSPEPIDALVREDRLRELKGVGESIGAKVHELVTSGKLKYLQTLRTKVAPQELMLLRVPGIGPKTARQIYKKIHFKTLKDLKRKLDSDPKLQQEFSLKGRLNIIRGITDHLSTSNRMLLSTATQIAQEIITALKNTPGLQQLVPAGSLRRGVETVGDLDFVAASTDPAALVEAFTKLPIVRRVILRGAAKSSVMTTRGIRVDLEIVSAREFGGLLQHFTGSKAHNVALRSYAQQHGLSISEHGVKKGRQTIAFASEDRLYKALKMQPIPPPLREDRGEIPVALKHALPNLVELADIKGDLHLHTNRSDGQMSLDQLVRAAKARGYEYCAVTDHSAGLGITHGLTGPQLVARRTELKRVERLVGGIHVLLGVEVNIHPDGSLDIEDRYLQQLDIVVASIHSSFYQDRSAVTQRLLRAISNPHVDVIGHPSGRLIERRRAVDADWETVFKAAARSRTALEINASPTRLDLNDSHIMLARSAGCHFVISTDTHQEGHLDFMPLGVLQAQRGWLQAKQVLNTHPYREFDRWLHSTQQ